LDIIGVAINLDDIGWEHIEMRAYMNSLSRTHDDFVKNLKSINPDITVLGEYKNTNKRLTVKCNTCGFTWEAVPANLLAGDGCRKCGTIKAHQRLLKAQDVFVKQISLVNPEIEITGVYTGRHSPVKARCKVCGYEWEPIASSLLRGSSHKGAKSRHHSNQ
jgi:predicted Zn-ribbon and HTH transcriptional regulator